MEVFDLLGGAHEVDPVRCLPHGANHLVVAVMANEDDVVAFGGEAADLQMYLGDQGAGGVDDLEIARPGLLPDCRGDPVGGEDDPAAGRHFIEVLDKNDPPLPKPIHHGLVVDNLLTDV